MRLAWTAVIAACGLLLGGVQSVQSQGTAAPEPKVRTAVLDLAAHNKMPDDDITEVITRLYQELRNTGRFDLVDRQQIVQAAGSEVAECADAACAARIGSAVGAEKAVYGDVTKVEIIYELTLSIVDVASGAVERTHVEKVAGHMGDVAKVGVKCAIDALLEPPVVSDYSKGDWRKVRAHGVGGRLMAVLPSHSDKLAVQKLAIRPTFGLGVHYDAQFRMKNGMEIHYTPSFEYWTQSDGKDDDNFMRVQHFSFNVADFRWLFATPAEKNWVFYLGLGPAFVLYTDYDPTRANQYPPDSNFQYHPKFAANVLAGLNRHMPRLGWMMDIGFKAKFWDPSTFNLGISLTRPFKSRSKDSGGEEGEAKQEDAPQPEPAAEEPRIF